VNSELPDGGDGKEYGTLDMFVSPNVTSQEVLRHVKTQDRHFQCGLLNSLHLY